MEGFYEGDSTKLRSVSPKVRKIGHWRAHPDSAYRLEGMAFPASFRIAELHPRANWEYDVVLRDGTRLRLSRSYRDRLDAVLDPAR